MKKLLPNAFIIGAQKAGTSSFFQWIGQHPDIFAPQEAKDYPFFSDSNEFNRGFEHYSYFFKNHSNEKIILAGGVHEVMSEDALERISSIAGIKIFFILRNPIERAYSAYNFNKDRGIEDIGSFIEALKVDENRVINNKLQIREFDYIQHGYYDEQLIKLKEYFQDSQIHIIFFDDIKNNKQQVINDALSFLDIHSHDLIDYKTINKSAIPKFPFINKILFGDMRFKKRLKNNRIFEWLLPSSTRIKLRRKLLQLNKSKKNHPPIDSQSKSFLISIYRPHITSLENLTSRNLQHWLE